MAIHFFSSCVNFARTIFLSYNFLLHAFTWRLVCDLLPSAWDVKTWWNASYCISMVSIITSIACGIGQTAYSSISTSNFKRQSNIILIETKLPSDNLTLTIVMQLQNFELKLNWCVVTEKRVYSSQYCLAKFQPPSLTGWLIRQKNRRTQAAKLTWKWQDDSSQAFLLTLIWSK